MPTKYYIELPSRDAAPLGVPLGRGVILRGRFIFSNF